MRRKSQEYTADSGNSDVFWEAKQDGKKRKKVLMLASVASMIDQFNLPNIDLLCQMGYEVHVACNFREGNTCSVKRVCKLQKKLRDMHVIWHQWDCPRDICAPARCRKAYRQLLELFANHAFAWIHCHSPIGGALARLAAHKAKIPVIYTAHGFHFYKGAPLKNRILYYSVEKLLAYWTDILITVNQEDYRFAERYLKAGKVFYIPGIGIDIEQLQIRMRTGSCDNMYFRRKYKIPEHALLLLSVGELSRRKNHQAVILALAELQRQDVYYVICGQGKQKYRLWNIAQKYGVAHLVRMTGFLEKVSSAYDCADIFVFPSLQEGLPVALMEAMAAGLPCVVSDIRGNRELICEKGGRRFSPTGCKSTEQLLQYLKELLDNRDIREACGHYNRKKIKAYDVTVVERHMKRIYKKTIGNDQSAAHRNRKV